MKLFNGTLLIIAAAIFVLVNLISGATLNNSRFDLTGDKIYTLSKGSKEIIAQLTEPIVLRMYFSKSIANSNPYLKNYSNRVLDMLHQYQSAADGKIILRVIDPVPFSSDEDEAINYGLQGIPVNNTGEVLFFGLVGSNSIDTLRVVPFFEPDREANLEYDISQLIYNLAFPQPKEIAIMSSLPLSNPDGSAWAILEQLESTFTLHNIDLDDPQLPTTISTLLIINPNTFSERAIQVIDQYVLQGGHVLTFVDPFSDFTGKPVGIGNADKLLNAWGLELSKQVVGDHKLARAVRLTHEGREITTHYPLWMDFTAQNFSREDILTNALDRLTVASPGYLTPTTDANSYFMPLISTTDEAMLVASDAVPQSQEEILNLINSYTATGKYTIAARISGQVRSAFDNSRISEQASIIIVADADMLYNHFWITDGVPTAANGNFVISALDNLSGSNSLINIRNRGAFSKPFAKVHTIEQQVIASKADMREIRHQISTKMHRLEILVQFLSFGLIPCLILAFGAVTWFMRSRRI